MYSWVNHAKSVDSSKSEMNSAELFEENKHLKKELALVKEQRDILKRAQASKVRVDKGSNRLMIRSPVDYEKMRKVS